MIKRIICAAITGFFALSMCGCNYLNTNLESLVTPPNLNEEQTEIYEALNLSLEEDETVALSYPNNGAYRSAIVLQNIDQEPGEEAIVFYQNSLQTSLDKTSLHVCILDQFDDAWRVVWDIPGSGTEVDRVLFYTDLQTGEPFTIVGYVTEEQLQNVYSVYHYTNGTLEQVYQEAYQALEVYDLNNDAQDDIITISYPEDTNGQSTNSNSTSLNTTAKLINHQNGQFVTLDETPTVGKAASYTNYTKDISSFGKPALFVDEQVSKSNYATEILTCENGKLKNLIYHDSTNLFEQTMRTQMETCYDFNQDGVLEIPKTDYFLGYNADSSTPLYQTKWYQLHGNALDPVCYSYVNYSQGYGFMLPDGWEQTVSVANVVENEEIVFFVYQGDVENIDDANKIFSIKTDTLSNVGANGIPTGYFEVMTVGQVVYVAKRYNTTDSSYILSEQEIKDRFVEMYISSES